jgi:hypothetical protein
MISKLNFIFIIVFYSMRKIKLEHTCIYFEEFLNQLNLLYEYRMDIYTCLITRKKNSRKIENL